MKDMSVDLLLTQKIVYGLTPSLTEKIKKIGFKAYVEEQLAPNDSKDAVYLQKFQSTKYVIEKNKKETEYSFTYLKKSSKELFETFNQKGVKEKNLPAFEVYADTWLRAIHSDWQLREMMVEFWHNHFNVNVQADDGVAISLPLYDAMIRKNCLGNFRKFLEDVAKSPAMLYYLDNYTSKASPANENYARELFELHTLGADNYLNHLYNKWKEVPRALEGKAVGYIDEDIYEAARSFTGWTVSDGSRHDKGGFFPNTGEFLYFEGWHDNYQKRVLGVEFDSNQPPMADGLKVLDLVAYHEGTAKFICKKLCKRFVSDTPSDALIKKISDIWLAHAKSDDQIKHVIRGILTSDEFKASVGQKSKRPFELVVSTLRALDVSIKPNSHLVQLFARTGQTPFMWSTPNGHPDVATYWHTPNFLLARWNIIFVLLREDWHNIIVPNLAYQMPKTIKEMTEYWLKKFLPARYGEKLFNLCARLIGDGADVNDEIVFDTEYNKRHKLVSMIMLIAMSPEFQVR